MNPLRRLILGGVLVGTATLLVGAGCTVRTGEGAVDGYAYVRADAIPVYVDRYPHTRYHGRDAYWVDGRWYWAGDDGWYVFRDEPRELYRWRSQYYTHTPSGPAFEGPGVQRPPPAWGGGPGGGPPPPSPPPGVQRPPPAY
jgi:hypothetical protein